MKYLILIIMIISFANGIDESEIDKLDRELDSKISNKSSVITIPLKNSNMDKIYKNYDVVVKNYKELKSKSNELNGIYKRSEKIKDIYRKYSILVRGYTTKIINSLKQKTICKAMEEKFKKKGEVDYTIIKLQNKIIKNCYLSHSIESIDFNKIYKEFEKFDKKIARVKEFALIDQTTASSLIKQVTAMEGMIRKSLYSLNIDEEDTNFQLMGDSKIANLAKLIDKNYAEMKSTSQDIFQMKTLIRDIAKHKRCYLNYYKYGKNSCNSIRIDLLKKFE